METLKVWPPYIFLSEGRMAGGVEEVRVPLPHPTGASMTRASELSVPIPTSEGSPAPRSRSIASAMRRAGRRLTPVVVDLGHGQPRLASYARHVEGGSEAATLHLEPIAADAIPEGRLVERVVVRSADPVDPFCLIARNIVPVGEHAARVSLSGARLETMKPRVRARRHGGPQSPLAVFLPGGTLGSEAHVFPLADLGTDFCSVESTVGLEPGLRLPALEIVNERRTLRRCAATVLESLPWRDPDGSRRFRARLQLHGAADTVPVDLHDLVVDAARVKRAIEIAAMVRARCRLHGAPWGRLDGRLVATDRDSVTFAFDEAPPLDAASAVLRVTFELFAVSYEMHVRLLEGGPTITTCLPLVLRRRRLRKQQRVDARGEVVVAFTEPVAGALVERAVRDLSFGGLAFEAETQRDLLWPGMPLENAVLEWRGHRVPVGDLEVRSVEPVAGGSTCHAAFHSRSVAEQGGMGDILAALGHADLRRGDGTDFRAMLETYKSAHLLTDWMTANLEPVLPKAAHTWRNMHAPGMDLVRTLRHERDGVTDAAITTLRAWERAWLVQHFGALSTDGFQWSGELQTAVIDYLLPRPDGRFVFFFVHAANTGMNAFYERFFELTGTPEAVERGRVKLFRLPPEDAERLRGSNAQAPMTRLRKSHEVAVARAAEIAFGPMTASALSFVPGEMSLPDCERQFRAAGLVRRRRGAVALADRTPAWALFTEDLSPGANLTWMLNAGWLFPLSAQADTEGQRSAVPSMPSRPPQPRAPTAIAS